MPRTKGWIVSLSVHAGLILLALLLASQTSSKLERKPIEVVFFEHDQPMMEPEPLIEEPEPEPEPELRPDSTPEPDPLPQVMQPEPEPVVVAEARPLVRQPEPYTPPTPRRVQPQVQEPKPQPKPKRTVKTAGFGGAPSPTPTRSLSPTKTASRGAFEQAPPTNTKQTNNKRTTTALGGFGDGKQTPRTSSKRSRTVATNGFGSETTTQAPSKRPSRSVSSGGFGGEGTAERGSPSKGRSVKRDPIDTPVEIVSKPKPVYTDKARELKIEGEVVLEVTFSARGSLHVKRVIDGLGYGLDEAAVKAAENIDFEPAKKNGKAVDYTATLRVVFRLA